MYILAQKNKARYPNVWGKNHDFFGILWVLVAFTTCEHANLMKLKGYP